MLDSVSGNNTVHEITVTPNYRGTQSVVLCVATANCCEKMPSLSQNDSVSSRDFLLKPRPEWLQLEGPSLQGPSRPSAGSSCPSAGSSCPSAGSSRPRAAQRFKHVIKDVAQTPLEHPQSWGTDRRSGSLFQCLTVLLAKECFLIFPWKKEFCNGTDISRTDYIHFISA